MSAILGVESPSATEMRGKLDDRGLVQREDYRASVLAERGCSIEPYRCDGLRGDTASK